MTETYPITAKELLTELTDMEAVIKAAMQQVIDKRQIDLVSLESRIDLVCDAALALPAEQSRSLLPLMEKIVANLDNLIAHLKKSFGNLPNLHSEPPPNEVAMAYGRSNKNNR
ncbi:MAG: hypothetical protein ACJZ9F_12850 [Rhodospirillaceae bacterium]